MPQLSEIERLPRAQDSPSRTCQHGLSPDSCGDCALIEVRDTLRELRPVIRAALANPLVKRWLGL